MIAGTSIFCLFAGLAGTSVCHSSRVSHMYRVLGCRNSCHERITLAFVFRGIPMISPGRRVHGHFLSRPNNGQRNFLAGAVV